MHNTYIQYHFPNSEYESILIHKSVACGQIQTHVYQHPTKIDTHESGFSLHMQQHENLIHAIQCIVIVFNDIMSKSHEQGLVTKEDIATHTNLFLLLYTPATRMACPLLKLKHSFC